MWQEGKMHTRSSIYVRPWLSEHKFKNVYGFRSFFSLPLNLPRQKFLKSLVDLQSKSGNCQLLHSPRTDSPNPSSGPSLDHRDQWLSTYTPHPGHNHLSHVRNPLRLGGVKDCLREPNSWKPLDNGADKYSTIENQNWESLIFLILA